MRIYTKSIVAFLLATLMIFYVLPFSVIAAETGTQTMVASLSSASGMPGDIIEVKVELLNNPGISSMKLFVEYDEMLELTEVTFDERFGLYVSAPTPYSSPQVLNLMSPFNDISANGTYATLKFKISENAPDNYKATINLNYDVDNLFNVNFEPVQLTTKSTFVTIFHGIPGDINNDKAVTNLDAILLFRYSSGDSSVSALIDTSAIDVNGDGKATNMDAILIFRFVSEWPGIVLLRGNVHTHNLEKTEPEPASCTENGNKAYWHCADCGKYFSNAEATVEISLNDTVIEKTGHTEVAIPDVAPDYDNPGSTGGIECSVCHEIIKEPIEVPPLTHNEIVITYDYTGRLSTSDTYLEQEIAKAIAEGKIKGLEPVDVTSESFTLPVIEPNTIPGYKFQGWYKTTATDDTTKIETIAQGTNKNQILYAEWTKTEYDITYFSPLVSIESLQSTDDPKYTKRTINETTALPTRDEMHVSNYTFMGWSDASGKIIEYIEPGVTNTKVFANYTSATRNIAIANDYEKQGPAFYFDEENGQYLFIYNIGRIDRVPIKKLKDWQVGGNPGEHYTLQTQTLDSTTFGNTEAKEINTIVANATTHSSSWTLSQDWNELITEMDGGNQSISEGTVIAISDGTSKAFSSEGSTYVGNSFHTSNDSKVTSKTITDDSFKNSAELEASLGYGPAKVSTKISGEQAHSEHQEDYKETNSSLQTSAEWNSSSGYSASENLQHTESRTNEVLKQAQSEWKHEISKAIGEEESKTSEESSQTSQTDGYTSTTSFYNETVKSVTITDSQTFTTPGHYKYVVYGTVYVYAVVGYDIKTGSFFVETVSAMSDDYSTGIDYSYDGSFKDYDNAVIPFEVPVDIYNYVYEQTAMTEGVNIDRTGKVMEYTGTATDVRIPDYVAFPNDDGEYQIVPVVSMADGLFMKAANKTEITSVRLGKNITAISNNAFNGCSSLKNVEYNTEALVSIGDNAFDGCKSLNTLEIGDSKECKVTSIGTDAFNGVPNVQVYATNAQIVENVVASGAQNISIYMKLLSDSEIAKLSGKTLKLKDNSETATLAIYGADKKYSDLSIDSNATKTIINGMTFENNTKTPLVLESANVELNRVNIINAPNMAIQFKADNTNLAIKSTNTISTNGDTAILSKELAISRISVSGEYSELNVTGGDIVVCGEIDALKNFAYLKVNDGVIRSVSITEYNNMLTSHKILFNANGGQNSVDSVTVTYNSPIGALPTPTKEGFTFLGWFLEDGTQVTEGTIFTSLTDITVKAHWLSDFVSADEVLPEGAIIAAEKWTYDVTTKIESDKDYEEGYTLYDTTFVWGETVGPLDYDPSDGIRNVWSEEYVASTTTHYKYYHRTDGNNNYAGDDGYEHWTRHEIDLTKQLKFYETSSTKKWDYYGPHRCDACGLNNCYRWIPDGTYVENHYATHWYYQDPIYTYYHSKTESFESLTEILPSENISNIQKYVQYVIE